MNLFTKFMNMPSNKTPTEINRLLDHMQRKGYKVDDDVRTIVTYLCDKVALSYWDQFGEAKPRIVTHIRDETGVETHIVAEIYNALEISGLTQHERDRKASPFAGGRNYGWSFSRKAERIFSGEES